MNDIIYDIWLSFVVMSNPSHTSQAIEIYGSAKAVYEDKAKKCSFGSADSKIKEFINTVDLDKINEILELCAKNDIEIIRYDDEYYPSYLYNCDVRPHILYIKGNKEILKKPLITITGSRKANYEGKENAAMFCKALEDAGIGIVTGFADGIEETVMRTAENPIAVMPCGILKPYPSSHKHLAEFLATNGGLLVSPFEPMVPAYKWNFVFRNKILAGISQSTLIVQAGKKSATAMTFDFCGDFSRTCYAIPGGLNDKYYMNTNEYLKAGASIVTTPEDIIADYSYIDKNIRSKNEPEKKVVHTFSSNQQKIVDAIREKPMFADEICEYTGLDINILITEIIQLELIDVVTRDDNDRLVLKLR